MELSFKLDDEFVEEYASRPVEWGFPSGEGVSVGELTFLRTYSNKKPDGTKERWHECCRRVVEGAFSIQKDYVLNVTNTPWDEEKAQASAREMYERLYTFKFWAPGRGLENMGTEGVNGWGYSDRLYNCAYVSTRVGGTEPYARVFLKAMRGVGVGYDALGAGRDRLQEPTGRFTYKIPDSTEGWVDSTRTLLDAYFYGKPEPDFEYDLIREEGSEIASGGVAPGPEPLRKLHEMLRKMLRENIGNLVNSRIICDIMNMEGKAVVAGGKRRTALIFLIRLNDHEGRNLKNASLPENAERLGPDGWGFAANHSIVMGVNDKDGLDFDAWLQSQVDNYGEPGIFFEDLTKNFGRLLDVDTRYTPDVQADPRAIGVNPCGEISLEDNEVCNVVSVNMDRHHDLEDFKRTLKFAFLYAKSVTLLPTSWPETNLVQNRNRRIGVSLTGVTQWLDWYEHNVISGQQNMSSLGMWMDEGYHTIREWDRVYSWWLGVRESIKVTTIKPEGSASLLPGATPGVHFPVHKQYIRRMRFSRVDPLLDVLRKAGYTVEPDKDNPHTTMVAEIPVRGPQISTESETPIWKKIMVAVTAQRYWSDNAVSFTLGFHPHELQELKMQLEVFWGKLKSFTTAPIFDESAVDAKAMQLPYEGISDERYAEEVAKLSAADLELVYNDSRAMEKVGDKYCEGDHCVIA